MEIGSDLAIKAGAVFRRSHSLHELLGHSDAGTSMVYTHVVAKGGLGVCSLLES